MIATEERTFRDVSNVPKAEMPAKIYTVFCGNIALSSGE
jgi:hypothetical protein